LCQGFNVPHANDEQQVKGIDLAGMDLWIRDWCDKHPTKLVAEGGIATGGSDALRDVRFGNPFAEVIR